MDILTKSVQFEEVIKGSRFLSELIPCETQAAARELIKAQKAKYSDATHVVHAFVIGPGAEVMGMSDDGEPSGTAGRPVLDVLKGRKCTNTVVTVTRWFGGTLLGTGGLVKAYSGGAKQVIEAADAEGAFEELIAKSSFSFTTNYSLYKLIKITMEQYHLYNVTEDFGSDIAISGEIRVDELESFSERMKDISNGNITVSKS